MRTIGLIGGMSYHSTALYYQHINAHVQRKLGSPNSASLILHSFNYAEINPLFTSRRWTDLAARFVQAGTQLRDHGAEALVLGANVAHRVAPEVETAVGLPVLHIADATARGLSAAGIKTVGLLGTRPVMEQSFIKDRLARRAGLDAVLVPDERDWDTMNALIFGDLAAGHVTDKTRRWMGSLAHGLRNRGAEAVVLACTEFQATLNAQEAGVPLYDSLQLHAQYAAGWAMGYVD
ncbi:glycoside hydrolase family 18 protein [Purpureocillium lavendulum]|uniref:Glycoside hydrolase family 18 protein n=1 Tax=Purpureocillium lavendulum TaxID=1247861 RepID=A0AB34FTQ5_9HYPO|nr:glycoside hydrolase family 18 protein [Purpureocillium lavendulum]